MADSGSKVGVALGVGLGAGVSVGPWLVGVGVAGRGVAVGAGLGNGELINLSLGDEDGFIRRVEAVSDIGAQGVKTPR
jgi:hypothetical protein